jgi:WD40 repeat protein
MLFLGPGLWGGDSGDARNPATGNEAGRVSNDSKPRAGGASDGSPIVDGNTGTLDESRGKNQPGPGPHVASGDDAVDEGGQPKPLPGSALPEGLPAMENPPVAPGRLPVGRIGGGGRRMSHWPGAAAMNADGTLAVLGGPDEIALWAWDKPEPVWTERCYRQYVTPLAFSPDGKSVACVDSNGHAVLRSVIDGGVTWQRESTEAAVALCFEPGGKSIFIGYSDGRIAQLSVVDDQAAREIARFERRPAGLYWEPRQGVLVATSEDFTIRAIDPASGEVLSTVVVDHRAYGIALTSDGRNFAHADEEGVLHLRGLADGVELKTFAPDKDATVWPPVWAGDDRALVRERRQTGMSLQLWDLITFEATDRVATPLLTSLAASADGRRAVSGDISGHICFWSLEGGIQELRAPTTSVVYAEWFPDGRTLIVGEEGGRVSIWDAATLTEKEGFATGDLGMEGMQFSPRGDTFVTVDSAWKPWLWNLESRERVSLGEEADAYSIQYSPDGAQVYLAVDKEIVSFGTADGSRVGTVLSTWRVASFRVNPDATRVAAGSDAVQMFELPADMERGETILGDVGDVHVLRFSPDGSLLAIATDKEIVLWDVRTKTERVRLAGVCFRIAFSPLGDELAAAMDGGTLRRVGTDGTVKETLDTEGVTQYALSYAPDGRRLLSVGADRAVRIWDVAD